MILKLILILIILYSLINYKKSFFLFTAYSIIWYDDPPFFVIGRVAVPPCLFMSLLYFALFYVHRNKTIKNKQRSSFPFVFPFVAITISWLITSIFVQYGFISEMMRVVNKTFQNMVMVWLVWKIVEEKKDFKYLFRLMTWIIFFACVYGLFEFATKGNPIYDFKNSMVIEGLQSDNYNLMADALGYRGYRIYSIFEHPIGAGMTFGLYISVVLNIFVNNKEEFKHKLLPFVTIALCIPCIILTKMRSAILFTLIACISAIDFEKKKFYKIAVLAVLVGILLIPLVIQNANMFLSMFNSSARTAYGGSTFDMRLDQLDAVLHIVSPSPIVGLGERYSDYIPMSTYVRTLRGSESVWFLVIAKHGIIGVISYVIFAYYCIRIIPKKFKSKELLWLSLAYWVTYTVTTIPSFRINVFFLVMFYYLKSSDAYKNLGMKKKELYFSRKERCN